MEKLDGCESWIDFVGPEGVREGEVEVVEEEEEEGCRTSPAWRQIWAAICVVLISV